MNRRDGEPYVIARIKHEDGTIRELVSTASPVYMWRTTTEPATT